MTREDQIRKAEDAFEAAGKKISKINGKAGAGTEDRYAAAYQVLVRLGVRPQIRKSYR